MPIRPLCTLCGLLLVLGAKTTPAQQPPEPSGPHPRLFNEPGTLEWRKEIAGPRASAVADRRAITAAPDHFGRDGQMGTGSTTIPTWTKRRAQTARTPAIIEGLRRAGDAASGTGTAPAGPA